LGEWQSNETRDPRCPKEKLCLVRFGATNEKRGGAKKLETIKIERGEVNGDAG